MSGPADALDLPEPRRGEPGSGQLEPGVERIDEFEVTGPLLTDVGGTIGVAVLSTPGMIAMMERTAAVLAYESLPEGSATVGFEVCIKHVAGAAEGAVCTATAKLTEVVDGASSSSTSRSARASGRSASAPTSAACHRRCRPRGRRDGWVPGRASGSARSARATASRTSRR